MTQHMQSLESVIFITHVEADDMYLKIWGQLDKQAATSVEHYIYPLIERFNQGYGCPSKSNRLSIGTLCCARFQSDGYYRAKILGIRPDGMIIVQFIDYGNVEILSPNEIHLWENIREMEPLQAYPPMALEFTLMNVLPINGVWENEIIEDIKKTLCYNEYRALFHVINNCNFIKLWYNNEDFSELLVKQRMALPATMPATIPVIPDIYRPKHILQMPAYQQQNKNNVNNCPTMPIMQTSNMNHNSNVQGFHKNPFSADINQYKHADQQPLQPPPAQEALVFKSRVLDVNSQYQVLISHVEDGPSKFSVQVESTQTILTQLMDEINSRPKQPLQEPPLPGSVCLGRYRETGEDGVLCRAVVMSVMEHKCKLYYVDFGHTEVLPYTDIFQLPPEYINPKVLSIRFTLSGLKELNITQEMKAYFKELVHRKLLILHVRPPEGPPLIQYGDLYDNGMNIKDMLKKAFPTPAPTISITYSYPQLQRLSKDVQEVVHVSYVESCKKFFVQLDKGIKSLESIMTGLAQYAKMASVLNAAQLKAGSPCAALYDSQWYRAQILSVTGEQVKVVYVDYGNEEIIPTVSLRAIHDDLVTSLPAQAIKCALNGYEVLSSDQEVSNHFERLTLEKRFYMKVVAAQPKGLLVDLFEFDTMRSIHPQLLNNLFCDKNSTSSPNGEIQHSMKPVNNFQSGDKDRYNKKNNTDTWNRNQNAKSYQDNKPNSWRGESTQEKQYNNRHDRTRAYSHRDRIDSQNDRFAKNETAYNRSSRDRAYHKHDKSEINGFKDLDTSFKGNSKRGKGSFNRDGFNNGREESYDNRASDRLQTSKWSDRKPIMARKPNYKNEKFTDDDYKRENNTSVFTNEQVNVCESWDTNNVDKKLQDIGVVNKEFQFLSINITPGSIKNCEVVYINSPFDFFVQLNPDCLELDTVMESITALYENGGETMSISEIQCNTCCIAQYSEDLKWYRVVIKSVEENSATVEFVDYGNTESVDFTKIKVIQEKFLKLPMQAVHCKLLGLTSDKEIEHAIFSEIVEGKSLEVEFVAEENKVYEVLLREIINGQPNTNYINEEFCSIAELQKAKETVAIKKTFKTTTENIQGAPDYASIDSKWKTTLYEPESKHDVIVTWFINPNKFYCQLLTNEAEFKIMMSEIQKAYVGKEPITHKLQVGSAIIAIFSEDRALYRAEVVNTSAHKDAYIIQYIDFGNCAIVKLCNIYPVEKRFMQLPKLAIQCSLKDIVPNNNLDWSKTNNNALDNCFNADKYKCILHDINNNQYTISLIHNGQDVSDMLVQKNLASFATKTSVETICGESKASDTKIRTLNDVERVDISLLSGQILKMKVSNVESVTLFHVQLQSASKYEDIVQKYMTDKNTKALALPGELAIMQNQALECSLQNVTASSDADKRLKELEGKEVLIMVEEVNNNRLIVKLYDLLGNKIMSMEEKMEKISPICLMPILSSTHKVSISNLENSTSIWLQRYSELELNTRLLEDLEKYYTNFGRTLKPEVNLLCVAKCLEDGNWYRARIINYTETTIYVHYIDYGNIEEISLDSIKVLEPQFYEPHQLAINVSLSITLIGTEAEQLNLLQTHLMNKEFTAVFYNVHKKWIVDLIENEEKLSDKFRSLNLLKEEQTTTSKLSDSETYEASKIDKFNVCVSHVDSPSQFWLQRVDEIASLNQKQEQLQLEVSNFSTIDSILEEGTLCVATYSIDNLWYRAEVLDADEDITTVRFIDYGNTDVINNKTDNIRQIPDAWKSLERFALKCRLDVIPVDTEDWNESTCERFEYLVTSTETLQALIVADTVPKRVELFINDKSISEMLVEEKHAIIINTEQEPVDEIVDLELDPHSAFVCHINSPSEFWVQEEKSVADLEVMADRFIVADMFPKIDNVKEGLLCVAKYPEDEQWYRARVISHDNNGNMQVIYIDYGNSAVSTEIRAIPEDLANISPLSRKCCLQLPPQIKEWSEQAHEEFVKLAADGATIFLLDVLKDEETSLVKLTLDGQNVADILVSMCEQHVPIIEERLPPLGEENSPNVVVSHINSPDEFWIQAESSISELEVMSDRLRDAESFLALNNLDIGTICAARYPEDGCWYRAKIIARCKTGTEVLYMDYGNSAITKELRILPEDIANIPILSKRCTLEQPSHISAWTEKACDKFKELAAEGATMFEFENLDEADPMHVRLSLNGTSVVELLLAEFESIPPKIEEITEKIEEITEKIEKITEKLPEIEEIISIAKEEQETVFHEDYKLVDNSEETSNLDKEAQQEQQEQTVNQTDNSNCINQTEKCEKGIDKEVFNESFIHSDIKEENKCKEEQPKHNKSLIEIEEKENEASKVMIAECTSRMEEISEDIVETNKDVDIAGNETISINAIIPTTSCLKESLLHVTELSIDEIVGNMIKDVVEDVESRKIDHTNLSVTNEMQLSDVAQTDEQQELLSQMQFINTNKSLNTQICKEHAIKDVENLDSKISSVTNESQFQDVVQLDNNQVKEHAEVQSNVNESLNNSKISEIILCLSKEEINLTPDSIKSETISESTNKNNDLETQPESTDSNTSSGSMCTVKMTESTSYVIKTDPVEQYNYSKRRSEDKIIPGCVSRGESPSDSEARMRPATPKTPYSEKLVAGAVNPIIQSVSASMNEEDEILVVSVE
ncbi:maternal protein tudor-like isoform X2 [Cataglyphis hispanica]|uniref:maternal protein tudor-like isoform X2 n=1 Tax=Cataglyphis hispanica TaxID=1086592 RepID=UPI00217FEAF6|nr:maternal protein tudor-like isoform X2 [Cataglyphis hispanica]